MSYRLRQATIPRVNPKRGHDVYLAFAALIAAGLHGLEQELELPPALEGNAYESGAERFPSSLRLFDEAVTCWERERLYERV